MNRDFSPSPGTPGEGWGGGQSKSEIRNPKSETAPTLTLPRGTRGGDNRNGFTLIELLAVMGIIAILIGLLLPAVLHARAKAHRVALQQELQVISSALEAYKTDFGDYPRPEYAAAMSNGASTPNPPTGAEMLCRALIAPAPAHDLTAGGNTIPAQDGHNGPGFTIQPAAKDSSGNWVSQGRTYGPYLKVDQFPVFSWDPTQTGNKLSPLVPFSSTSFNPLQAVITDMDGNPILYFPARVSKPDISKMSTSAGAGGNYVGLSSQYNPKYMQFCEYDADQNWAYMHFKFDHGQVVWRSPADQSEAGGSSSTSSLGYKRICSMLGDYDAQGTIDIGDKSVSQPFILWCAGSDGKFGADQGKATGTQIGKLDDATNIER